MLSDLPVAPLHENLARQVRVAPVAPYLHTLFSRLPRPLTLSARLPADPLRVPLAARQLLKLALSSRDLALAAPPRVDDDAAIELVVASDTRRCAFDAAALAGDVGDVVQRALEVLLEPGEFARLLATFAFESTNLETLQKLTSHMLQSTDVDQAIYIMLSGVTSGRGLGFNRAALFLYDESRRVFVGSKGIGPADAAEAHRIWEEIEYDDKATFEQLVEDYARRNFDTRFQQFVQTLVLEAGEGGSDDEVALALPSRAPVPFARPEGACNPGLRALGAAGEFVLAVLKPHGRLAGIVFADNAYSATPVAPAQVAFLGFYIDQTALLHENLSLLRRVEALARIDGLTGVLNRRAFDARLADECALAARTRGALGALLVDLDHFKSINDTLGHEAGDDALRSVAALLRGALRPNDALARYGGDEFAALLPGAGRAEALAVATRLGARAREAGVSLSVGVASFPEDCDAPGALVAAADRNLYAAKGAGRGRAGYARGETAAFERG